MSLTVVTHHIGMPDEQRDLLSQWLPDIGKQDVIEWVRMLGSSARWASSGCRLVLLTDNTTRIPDDLPWDVKRYHMAATPQGVNHHRMYARVKFCETAPPGEYIFCDADVLLNRIPEMSFDMGITLRFCGEEGGMKVQEGVMYCGNILAAKDYFSEILDRMVHGTEDERIDWGGTQKAAANMLFPLAVNGHKYRPNFMWRGWRFAMLPLLKYNWSPESDNAVPKKEAYAWHFKGDRKPMMAGYYEYLQQRREMAA